MPAPIDYPCIRRMSTITVPNQDIHFDVYDFEHCKPQTNIDTTLESRRLEADYCRDFSCCGLVLNDLHDLLQHYEECHVQCEDEDEDTWSSTPPLSPTCTPPLSPTTPNMKQTAAASYLSDIYNHVASGSSSSVGGYDDMDPMTPTTPGFSSDGEYSMPPTPINEEHPSLLLDPSASATTTKAAAAAAAAAMMMNRPIGSGTALSTEEDNEDDDENSRLCGKKRTFQQISSTNAMDLLTLSAAKKLAMTAGESFNCLSDEDFLAHAGVLLASTNTSYLYADKPYKCAVKNCPKMYKNANGLKYHNEHGHSETEDNETPKPYQCTIHNCGKKYKNLNGLKYHIEHSHLAALNHTLATFGTSFLQTPPPPAATASSLIDATDVAFF